jgi:hypothetical protein
MSNPFDALSVSNQTPKAQFRQEPSCEVQVMTNPLLAAKICIDGQLIHGAGTVMLTPGMHTFSAISNISELDITYSFDQWTNNGKSISYNPTTMINITGPCTITAQYILGQAGVNAPVGTADSLPNPRGPMTPNLILNNPR